MLQYLDIIIHQIDIYVLILFYNFLMDTHTRKNVDVFYYTWKVKTLKAYNIIYIMGKLQNFEKSNDFGRYDSFGQ